MELRFVLDPELTVDLREQIISLWTDVTNAGGAVGFVAPVTRDEVRVTADATFAGVAEGHDRLLIGYEDGRLVALLFFTGNRFALKEHFCVLKRVMVHPDCQGRGYGVALMREAERLARGFGLAALHITARGGLGLEAFYERCGYKEVGRLPGALRVAPGDDRDEVLMWLALA
ncbi:Acetyltransferase (GNAT) family protein [Micromonospora pattaloongensis]|uniref:Acetyltransferase (GNAT) family protein n=1 Tax=Micromonospora pattaloongensis TaxID=405436 RepID=A0A1H3FQN4_9ACTN|nr:GNAT family N-acetyltransferase [Micromonospora pattaloongensis]SDX93382.1 Acetyltransferase (GNAT) family protein [Micromonospora pattaloongensis]